MNTGAGGWGGIRASDDPPLSDIPYGCGFFTGPWTVIPLGGSVRSMLSDGHGSQCSLWCRFRDSGAKLVHWGLCRLLRG